MTQYKIGNEASGLSIELTGVTRHKRELLEAFNDCQEGNCSCPTDEYLKVASMELDVGEDRIAIHLQAKPGVRMDAAEVERCLDHTIRVVDQV